MSVKVILSTHVGLGQFTVESEGPDGKSAAREAIRARAACLAQNKSEIARAQSDHVKPALEPTAA